MLNYLTITIILLSIGESYPQNDKFNHPTAKCQESTTIIPENILSFLTFLRQIQRDIDQTKQSFNDVIRQNQYWTVRKSNGDEIINEKCINIIKLERSRFANYVLEHENDFENCADQLIEKYKKNEYTGNLIIMENETLKCISIIRQTKFWAEYELSRRHFNEVCTAEDLIKNVN